MRAIGQDRLRRVLVLMNSDESDPAFQDTVVVDVDRNRICAATAMHSLLGNEYSAEVDPALAAHAIALVREATATGTPPRTEDQSPTPSFEEKLKTIWPELKIESGTSGRAITIVGTSTSKRKSDHRLA